jgi:hypothetical protein
MLKRVLQWQSVGTGLDTIRFKKLVDIHNPPSMLDQGRAQAPVPVQLAPRRVPFEDAKSIDDDDRDDDRDDESYTLRADNDSKNKEEEEEEEQDDDDDDDCDEITLECGSFDMDSAFDKLKLKKGGVPGSINMNVKKKEAAARVGTVPGARAAVRKKEDEHDPVLDR